MGSLTGSAIRCWIGVFFEPVGVIWNGFATVLIFCRILVSLTMPGFVVCVLWSFSNFGYWQCWKCKRASDWPMATSTIGVMRSFIHDCGNDLFLIFSREGSISMNQMFKLNYRCYRIELILIHSTMVLFFSIIRKLDGMYLFCYPFFNGNFQLLCVEIFEPFDYCMTYPMSLWLTYPMKSRYGDYTPVLFDFWWKNCGTLL